MQESPPAPDGARWLVSRPAALPQLWSRGIAPQGRTGTRRPSTTGHTNGRTGLGPPETKVQERSSSHDRLQSAPGLGPEGGATMPACGCGSTLLTLNSPSLPPERPQSQAGVIPPLCWDQMEHTEPGKSRVLTLHWDRMGPGSCQPAWAKVNLLCVPKGGSEPAVPTAWGLCGERVQVCLTAAAGRPQGLLPPEAPLPPWGQQRLPHVATLPRFLTPPMCTPRVNTLLMGVYMTTRTPQASPWPASFFPP